MQRTVAAAFLTLAMTLRVAEATTVLRFGPVELTDRADVIAHGRVLEATSRRAPDGAIVTDYRLSVLELLTHPLPAGAGRAELSFTCYGGVVAERGSAIAGAATFEVGEEVLVFLDRPNAVGCRWTIGLAQGKYTVRHEEGRRVAYRNLEGLRVVHEVTGVVEEAEPEQGVPLEDLLAIVRRRLVERERGTRGER